MTPDAKDMIAGNSRPQSGRAPTVAAGLVKGLADYAAGRGADRAALLAAAGVTEAQIADLDGRVPFGSYVALMRAAKIACDDPALSLHFAQALDLSEVSVVGLISHAAETMTEAFLQLNRYGRLVMEVEGVADGERFALVMRGQEVWLVDQRANPNDFPELTESTFTRFAVGPRRFLPRPIVTAVEVTHPRPSHAAEYEQVLGAPVTFGADWNAVRMDMTLADHPVAALPGYAFGVLADRADALLASLRDATTLRGRVEGLLLPVLHTGKASALYAAGQLGVSRQTLFRRLKAEGTSFEALLDGLRRRLALDYLSARKVSVNETAYLVGFSEPAAFSRAFKRWTGKSPREVRYGAPA
ncbi:MAG: AraC family transcriptional regulator [Caulobacter sp.]|jgi:AraC-like DNA-binding protein|nr:AraC family transcriptional regulator [Caulobacter sp.]